ncbi:MAG TPA: hypothetical protein VE871_06770 [Longimicrobium sp.]|nr:hypothetical protein [Longimicrobium sp.]
MKRLALLALLPLSLNACGPIFRSSPEADANALRLCVQNATAGQGNVVARVGLVNFNVMPGQEQCRPVALTGSYLPLNASTTGAGVAGTLSYAERLHPGATTCWRWRLTNSASSPRDVTPCDGDAAAGRSAGTSRGTR